MVEVFAWPPPTIAEWLPLWKAVGCFFATFVLEDAAAVGAGLLLATGAISWPVAFTSVFLGIWFGDYGLYALARYAGRSWFERSSLRRFAGKVAESERWFAERGVMILILSRLIPGSRLPTYLAAGFLRVPALRFLLITGVAACVWTIVILLLAQTLGVKLTEWLGNYKQGGLLLLGAGILLFATLQLGRRAFLRFDSRHFAARLGRWQHWEFWPAWMFYPPVAIYCAWLAIKYRGLTLPTTANPGIFTGGIVGESKSAMLDELAETSPAFTAEAALVAGESSDSRLRAFENASARLGLDYPFILKPDLGQRGDGVKLIRNRAQAQDYLRQTAAPVVAQRYAPGPFEIGVFYYRFPHEPRGRIFALTEKIFPVLTGDGRSTVAELIHRDARARFIADTYLRRFHARRGEVLAAGEQLKLVESGNHAKGCIFRDGMHLRTPELETRIDEISQKLGGFFIGRYDIRYTSEDDLRTGRNFQIIELNGASSEATSIYDARNSLWAAYQMLFRQWELVFAIGAANRARGAAPAKFSTVWRQWRSYHAQAASYPAAD